MSRVKLYIAIGALVAILAILFIIWVRKPEPDEQMKQDVKSAEAISNAAQGAIATIGNRTATDAVIDEATDRALRNINDAQDILDMRRAVLDGVCGQASHRDDPACDMR